MLTMCRSSRSESISSRTGWTTRQGPHHGAQKSTSTAPSASMTSALKVASVTSARFPLTAIAFPRSGLEVHYFRKYSAPLRRHQRVVVPAGAEVRPPLRARSGGASGLFDGRLFARVLGALHVVRAKAKAGDPDDR